MGSLSHTCVLKNLRNHSNSYTILNDWKRLWLIFFCVLVRLLAGWHRFCLLRGCRLVNFSYRSCDVYMRIWLFTEETAGVLVGISVPWTIRPLRTFAGARAVARTNRQDGEQTELHGLWRQQTRKQRAEQLCGGQLYHTAPARQRSHRCQSQEARRHTQHNFHIW